MWIVAVGWMYVALMMALAEGVSAQGTILGAIITFLFYGLGPVALLMYILNTPNRRRKRQAAEHAALGGVLDGALEATPVPSSERASSVLDPDQGRHSTRD